LPLSWKFEKEEASSDFNKFKLLEFELLSLRNESSAAAAAATAPSLLSLV
jgi:hypothetical protein